MDNILNRIDNIALMLKIIEIIKKEIGSMDLVIVAHLVSQKSTNLDALLCVHQFGRRMKDWS